MGEDVSVDCAISLFGNAGLFSFILFLVFVALLAYVIVVSWKIKELKAELDELRKRMKQS